MTAAHASKRLKTAMQIADTMPTVLAHQRTTVTPLTPFQKKAMTATTTTATTRAMAVMPGPMKNIPMSKTANPTPMAGQGISEVVSLLSADDSFIALLSFFLYQLLLGQRHPALPFSLSLSP